jgi:hypothetical protein
MSVQKILNAPSCLASQYYLLTPNERKELYQKIHPKHLLSYATLVFRDLKDTDPNELFPTKEYFPMKIHQEQMNTILRFYHLLCIEFQIEEFYLGNCCMDILLNYKPYIYDIYLYKRPKISYFGLQAQHDLYTVEESESWYRVHQFYMHKKIISKPTHLYTYYDHRTKTLWGRRDFLFLYYCCCFRKDIQIEEIKEDFNLYSRPGNLKFK